MKKNKKISESNITISKNTQRVIANTIKAKKYIKDTSNLKVSFSDLLDIVIQLKNALAQDPNNLDIKKAIKELQGKNS
jgi:hypothetical protein